jgi:parallel beta-helix repeat protein
MSRVAHRVHQHRRRGAAVVGVLLAALAVLLVTAVVQQAPSTGAGTTGDASVFGGGPVGAPPVPRPGPGPAVAYTGPRGVIAGPALLRAWARGRGARVIAVTFLLDGRPVGTDTTPPYRMNIAGLPSGPHQVSAEAVDWLGRRNRSAAVPVRLAPPAARIVTGPGAGFSRAAAALARGHVSVRLQPGHYVTRTLRLGPGARLIGSGPETVLAARYGVWSLLTTEGRHIQVSDLTLDGAGQAGRGVAVGDGSFDVRLQRLRISGVRENGVEVWGVHGDISIQDSVIDGGGAGGAGVYDLGSDRSHDVSVVRSRVSGFRAYGIDFAQRYYRRRSAALHNLALDNRVSGINDPTTASGRREGAIWSGGVAASIIGNRVRNTGWDGIQTVGSSRGTSIVENDIASTRTGIYLEHETNQSVIAGNTIADVITGINSEWRYGGKGSGQNTVAGNHILRARQTGVFIDVAGDRNRIARNVIADGDGPGIVLQGASNNSVTGNLRCGAGDAPVVQEQSAHHDDGVRADSLGNRIAGNRRLSSCP